MDRESLKIFKAVAAELSITQASVRLGRAPSNVTTRIQQLEADVGAELFVRAGKRMTLSVAGECFLDYAQRMLALEEEAFFTSAAWKARLPVVCHPCWRPTTDASLQPSWTSVRGRLVHWWKWCATADWIAPLWHCHPRWLEPRRWPNWDCP